MDRQHRHDLKHDKFVDEIGALSSRARENQRVLIAIAGLVIAAAVIAYGIYFYQSNQESKAQQLLADAIETFDAPVGEQAQQNPNQTGPKFKTEEERNTAAEKQFKEVQAKHSSTDASDVAGLFLARIAVARGDVATGRKQLEEFVGDHKDHILVSVARFSLYQLRIENGEAAKVATELDAEMSKPEPVLPGDSILVLLAQAYEAQGNHAKSVEAYRRITTEFPDSPYVIEAQRRLG